MFFCLAMTSMHENKLAYLCTYKYYDMREIRAEITDFDFMIAESAYIRPSLWAS